MLMRTSKPVRVTRRGVTLKIHGLELDFYTPELANLRMQDKVYLRYDPEDLSKCGSTIWRTVSSRKPRRAS